MAYAFPSGFLVNDPDHAPFGLAWLRGVTPVRLGTVAVVCMMMATFAPISPLVRANYAEAGAAFLGTWGAYFACAMPMLFLVIHVEEHTAAWPARRRVPALLLAILAGAVAFASLRYGTRVLHNTTGDSLRYWEVYVAQLFRSSILGGLLTAVLYHARSERRAQDEARRTRVAAVEMLRVLGEARLQLLQSQIEPHFLFNSLASVKQLYQTQPERGRSLLRGVRDYLAIAVPHGRHRDVPLADEVALAQSFLSIFQVRMGGRLRLAIDVPEELAQARVPPLMLGTLVENAVKHGVGPRASGGRIEISARQAAGLLEIEVADDGIGFHGETGHGIGLANTRARLATLFEGLGQLDLRTNAHGGVSARLRLPYTTTSAVVAA